jgi:hypothetical protein
VLTEYFLEADTELTSGERCRDGKAMNPHFTSYSPSDTYLGLLDKRICYFDAETDGVAVKLYLNKIANPMLKLLNSFLSYRFLGRIA